MVDLEDLLGFDREDPEQRLAHELAEQDQDLIRDLVKMRRTKGLRQEDVARALGVAQSTVAAFERSGNDPRLSTIRRYALAVGALVEHSVRPYNLDREALRAAGLLGQSEPTAAAARKFEQQLRLAVRTIESRSSEHEKRDEDVWVSG